MLNSGKGVNTLDDLKYMARALLKRHDPEFYAKHVAVHENSAPKRAVLVGDDQAERA